MQQQTSPSKRGQAPTANPSQSVNPKDSDSSTSKADSFEEKWEKFRQKVAIGGVAKDPIATSHFDHLSVQKKAIQANTGDRVSAAEQRGSTQQEAHNNDVQNSRATVGGQSTTQLAIDLPAQDELSSVPPCVIPVSFSNTSNSINPALTTANLSTTNNVSQFVDAEYSMVNSGRDLCRTSKTRNLLIKSPSATKRMMNLQLHGTTAAHAAVSNSNVSLKKRTSFSSLADVAAVSSVTQTPSHYYASPYRNETPFSPIKRRKLFKSSELPGNEAVDQLDDQFEDLPVFVHVSTPKTKNEIKPGHSSNANPLVAQDVFKIPITTAAASLDSNSTKSNVNSSFEGTSAPIAVDNNSNLGYELLATKLKISSKGLCSVLPKASKVVTTRDWKMAQDEVRISNVLQNMEKLKEQNLWSFKQIKGQVHPPRPKVQWDYMLEEMAWMSEDFRQERRWKVAAAYNVSRWILEWHATTDKSLVCVRVATREYDDQMSDVAMISETENIAVGNDTQDPSPWRDGSNLNDNEPKTKQISQGIDPKSIQVKAPHNDQSSSFPITIDLSSNTYLLSPNAPLQSGLSHIKTYVCPVFNPLDLFKENEEQIVPISKFMLSRYHVPNAQGYPLEERNIQKRGIRGNSHFLLKEQQKASFNSLFVSLAADQSDIKDESLQPHFEPPINLLNPPPGTARPDSTTAAPGWTGDEEDALWQFAHIYHGNWALVADSLNGVRVGNSGKRSVWCCFDKYVELANSSFNPHSSVDYLFAPNQSNKKDRKVKALGLLSTFNFIIGLAKRTRPKFSKPNKPVNLAAHHTHKDVKIEKGIDLNGPALRAIELSKLKEQRDAIAEQNRQAAYQSTFIRQQSSQSLTSRSMMAPGMPPGNNFRPRPLNPQQQTQMNQFAMQSQGMPSFRAPFQGSPKQIPQQVGSPSLSGGARSMTGFTAEQLQQMAAMNRMGLNAGRPLNLNDQQAATQAMQFGQSMANMQRLVQQQLIARPAANISQMASGQSRSQLNDASTAAAYAALQNAQNAMKHNNARPVQNQVPPPVDQVNAIVPEKGSTDSSIKNEDTIKNAAASTSLENNQLKNDHSMKSNSNSSSPARTSRKKTTVSPPVPVDQSILEIDEDVMMEETENPEKAKKDEALPKSSKDPSPGNELSAPVRRTSRLSNPSVSQNIVPPTPSATLAAVASLKPSAAIPRSNRSRKQKQLILSETEDDELEGGDEEDELEQTEASSAITSIEEDGSDVAPSPKKSGTRSSVRSNRKNTRKKNK